MATHQQKESQATYQKRRLNVFPKSTTSRKSNHFDEALDDELTPDATLPNQSMSNQSVSNQSASNQSASNQSVSNQSVSNQIVPAEILCQTTGEYSTALIDRQLTKIMDQGNAVLRDRHPASLHQLRVHGRRLWAIVELLQPVLILPKKAQLKRLGSFHQALGEARDCDVITEMLRHDYHPNLPEAEQQLLQQCLSNLEKRQKSLYKKVKATICEQTFVSAYKQWLSDPQYSALGQQSIGNLLPGLILSEFMKYHHHNGWSITGELPAQQDQEQLHCLRKIVKHFRYQLEAFQIMYDDELHLWSESLKKTQSVLGAIADLNLLNSSILPDAMPVAHSLWQEQYKRAWAEWKTLRNAHWQVDQYACCTLLLEPLQQMTMA
jgi:CHAD domain-containing protein